MSYLNGKEVAFSSPAQAKAAGLSYLPEDRQRTAVLPQFSLTDNIVLGSLYKYVSHGFLSRKSCRTAAENYIERFHIRTESPETELRNLSGGNQQKAVIEVKDSGPGFSKEDSEHIFERYYTCKGKEKKSGTGLGLYITKMLAELHGGQIKVVSEIGKGTCFQVELPFDKEGETR